MSKRGKKSAPRKKSPSPKARRRRRVVVGESDSSGEELVVIPRGRAERWPFKSDSECFVPVMEHLSDEERAFVDAVDKWVEYGVDLPTGPLWQVVAEHGDGYLKHMYGNPEEFAASRHPRAILARFNVAPMHVRVALTHSLAKFLSDPKQVMDCVAFVVQKGRDVAALLPRFLRPEVPELVREFARQVQVVLENPAIFPRLFPEYPGYHFGRDDRFLLTNDYCGPVFPFETWPVHEVTEEQLASPMFQIECREVQLRFFEYVVNTDAATRRFGFRDEVVGLSFCKLLRRALDMALRTGLRTPAQLAVSVATAQNIVRILLKCPPMVEVELGDIVKQTMRHAEVTSASLDEGVRKLLLTNCTYIHAGVVAMMRLLLSCGASTLLRDAAGFLLVTNVRGGVIYEEPGSQPPPRGFFGYYGNYNRRGQQSDSGQKLNFQTTDLQRDLVDLVCEYGANWTRANHRLFPQEFRQRVFTFLLVNRRQRTAKMPWLPRDPLEIIFKKVATSDYCDDAQQLEETKALLSRTYAAFSDSELKASCKAADTKRGQYFYRRVHGAPIVQKPFKRFCDKRGVSLSSKKDATREFFIDFLVAQELGLLDDEQPVAAPASRAASVALLP
jgi:hypothetical protein